METLFGMMNSVVRDKENEENQRIIEALSGIHTYTDVVNVMNLRLRTHVNFGIEYDVPQSWCRFDSKEPDCVMYFAKGFKNGRAVMPAAFRISRKRGDYRGYENLDRLERLALYTAKTPSCYSFKYLKEVNINGRKGIKAVCTDNKSIGGPYDTDIYFFYKSKTEVVIAFCITAEDSRAYYNRVFYEILSSIRYIR